MWMSPAENRGWHLHLYIPHQWETRVAQDRFLSHPATIHQPLKMLLTHSHINYWCRKPSTPSPVTSSFLSAEQKGSFPLKTTNKNIYINVQAQFAEFILYRDKKTPTHQKPLTPFRASIFKRAKPTGPQRQTLQFWEKKKHVWNLKKKKFCHHI